MTPLAACPSCSRHVRIDEARCPFCAAELEGAFADRPAPRAIVGRLSRAAIFAIGTSAAATGTIIGCSDDSDTGGSVMALYGAPSIDAAADADAADTGSNSALYGAPPGPEDSGANGVLYGAPPNTDQ